MLLASGKIRSVFIHIHYLCYRGLSMRPAESRLMASKISAAALKH